MEYGNFQRGSESQKRGNIRDNSAEFQAAIGQVENAATSEIAELFISLQQSLSGLHDVVRYVENRLNPLLGSENPIHDIELLSTSCQFSGSLADAILSVSIVTRDLNVILARLKL